MKVILDGIKCRIYYEYTYSINSATEEDISGIFVALAAVHMDGLNKTVKIFLRI